ncbi:MAG: Ni/Fe-hydrogenase cytochrome b subunit, partial [Deltaproteobacteria bacterium]|nr:Ni/Fe-hydrogenase cytochrome b subunit [Deltaproteobacteria bacterium]
MNNRYEAASVDRKFLSPGVFVLLAFMAVGLVFIAARYIFGIGAVTHLSNEYPWGIWIGLDVAAGVALAAGGFTTGLLALVFHRDRYMTVVRPALVSAMLGYTFVVLALLVDTGRYWNIWRPIFHWNSRSVLFEVAMCVILYLVVLYIEFIPIVTERFKNKVSFPGFLALLNGWGERLLSLADSILGKGMWFFIIAGLVLSCLHQSSLGALMLIAPQKVHPLWYTPILPLLFLLSAIAVGYPMVIIESVITSKSFKREPEMDVLTPLAAFTPVLIGIYLVFKIGDIIGRGAFAFLFDGTFQANAFLVEMSFGLILPFILFLFRRVRQSPAWLFFASILYAGGVLLNRVNVFIVGYSPPFQIKSYFPAVGEIAITIGLISGLIFLYRVLVFIFPVLGTHGKKVVAKTLPVFLISSMVFGIIFVPHSDAASESSGRFNRVEQFL